MSYRINLRIDTRKLPVGEDGLPQRPAERITKRQEFGIPTEPLEKIVRNPDSFHYLEIITEIESETVANRWVDYLRTTPEFISVSITEI